MNCEEESLNVWWVACGGVRGDVGGDVGGDGVCMLR